METRELFWSLGSTGIATFYVLGFAAIGVFIWGCWRHVAKYRRGTALPVRLDIRAGARAMVRDVLSHATLVRRDLYAGIAHMGIFFGFALAALGTAIITLEYDLLWPLFGIRFWRGDFYLGFSLILDLGHLALTAGIVLMMVRRAGFHLAKLDYVRAYRGETDLRPVAKIWRLEDWAFLIVLLVIQLTGFTLEGVRILMDRPEWAAWSPVGNGLANLFAAMGMKIETAAAIRGANWWIHGGLALAFTAAIPWYKAKHIVAVIGSLAVRDAKSLARLPRETDASTAGISNISGFSWKDLLNFDACTKCGRCHQACPARATGYPLSPRDFILDLRHHADQTQGHKTDGIALVGDVLDAETIWSCRTCGACMDICPVGIEHPTMIVALRRQLVERGEMDPLMQSTLDTIGNTGNSFGESSKSRAAWTRELDFPIKDIRDQPAEILWFVGDYAAFDPRNQKVSRTVARLLRAANVDFALLHEGERNAGNDVRRVGEEGLFETLAEANLGAMAQAKPFSRIITTDPHSYNTLKNEYPEFGDIAPIEHYSALLAELFDERRLTVKTPLKKRVTFHDPCHLGRLNGGYEAPRAVLRATGCDLVEMPRNRANSFCCGAGGGRIWIPDRPGAEKPAENRMREAAALGGIDSFVTCCPKDLTMFEDARKTSGHQTEFVVEDLAELVAQAVQLEAISTEDLPVLAERIADAVANRVADVVAARLDDVLAARLGAIAVDMPSARTPEASSPEPEPVPVAKTPAPATPVVVEDEGPGPVTSINRMQWEAPQPVVPASFDTYAPPARDGLRILVAVKHAALLGDEYEFTATGRDIGAEYLEHALNEWDDAALEEALVLADKLGGGEVVAVTVGPRGAGATLAKVLAKGAARAVRIWSDDLTGADPITIARAIAGVAVKENADLILCGVQSGDFAHGATGTALARILGLPLGVGVIELDWNGTDALVVTRELEGGVRHVFKMPSPAVLTIQTGGSPPRYATMRMIKQAKKKPLEVLDGSGVVDGSGGYVIRRMYTPEQQKAQMLEGSAAEIAAAIADIIRDSQGER